MPCLVLTLAGVGLLPSSTVLAKPAVSDTPKKPAKSQPAPAKEPSPQWEAQVQTGAYFFGPIIYDRLAVYDGTGVPKRDPQSRSYLVGAKLEHLNQDSGYFVRALARFFDPTENSERGLFS